MSLACASCGKSFKRPQDLGQHTSTCDKKRSFDELSVGVEPKPTKTARAGLVAPGSTGAAGDHDPEVVDYEDGNDFEDTMAPSSPPAPRVGMFGYV